MKRTALVPLVPSAALAIVVATMVATISAAPAQAQQWPTADPAYSAPNPLLAAPEGFGAPGPIVVSSDFDLDLSYSKYSGADSGATYLQLAPALAFFLVHNLAVGGSLNFEYVATSSVDTTRVTVGPLVGYNIPLGPRLSLFPTASLGYAWEKRSQDVSGGVVSSTGHRSFLTLRAPVLFHPFAHVFVGLAPFLSFDLSAKDDGPKARVFGLTLDLGFWL